MKILGVERKRCPKRPVLEKPQEFAYWLQLYRLYRNGMLPEPGAYMEQCYVTLRVFNILDAIYAKIDKHREDERAKTAKRASKGAGSAPGGGRLTSRG